MRKHAADFAFLASFGVGIGGVWCYSHPLALIIAGVGGMAIAFLVGQSK